MNVYGHSLYIRCVLLHTARQNASDESQNGYVGKAAGVLQGEEMADISYDRITPRARSGTAGFSSDTDIEQSTGVWISPPERVAAVTVAVHIPEGETAEFAIECCCNSIDTIGSDGTGGWWDPIEWEYESYTIDTVKMVANAVTGIRVRCISCDSTINVCFVA